MAVLVLLASCKAAEITTAETDASRTGTDMDSTYHSASSNLVHSPSTPDQFMASVPNENFIFVSNDLWDPECGPNRMEVTVWSGSKAGIGWAHESRNSGTLSIGGAPGFPESFPLNIDVSLGNEGKTAMVVFQTQGRVYYNVYNWKNSAFELTKGPVQLGDLSVQGYGVPRIDCDPDNDDRVIITFASYKAGQTNVSTEEIWAVAGYINGNMVNENNPYPVSEEGGVSTAFESYRPDVSCRNGKGYFVYSYVNAIKDHVLVEQEISWNSIATGKAPVRLHKALRTNGKRFVYPKIAANTQKAGVVEWQVVTSELVDTVRHIIGFTKIHGVAGTTTSQISGPSLRKCDNSQPAVAICKDHILVAWIHESRGCMPDLVEKDLLVQRLSITTGKPSTPDDFSRLNSQQLGDQRGLSIAGFFGCENAFYGFHDAHMNEILTKSSHYSNLVLNPVNTLTELDMTPLSAGDETDPGKGIDGSSISMRTYPNPASEFINIDLDASWNETTMVTLFSNTGTAIKSVNATLPRTSINVSDLESGSVFVVVSDDEKRVRKQLLIETI